MSHREILVGTIKGPNSKSLKSNGQVLGLFQWVQTEFGNLDNYFFLFNVWIFWYWYRWGCICQSDWYPQVHSFLLNWIGHGDMSKILQGDPKLLKFLHLLPRSIWNSYDTNLDHNNIKWHKSREYISMLPFGICEAQNGCSSPSQLCYEGKVRWQKPSERQYLPRKATMVGVT